jgi:hypothetical protein
MALPRAYGFLCGNNDTGIPDHDIDHDISSHGHLDLGTTPRSRLPRHQHKGYHLTQAPRFPLQAKYPRRDIVDDARGTTTGECHPVGSYLWFLSSLTIRDNSIVHVTTATTAGEC